MKKRISTFLTMFLLVFLLGLNVCAASPVAQIGSKKYSSLEKAISAVKKGQTITLKKNTTINGGNYSIKGTWGFVYVYDNCTLNIKGGNIKSQWSLVETYSERSNANISGGTFIAPNKPYAYWKDPNSAGSIKVSKKVKMLTPNLWKKTDNICA